MENQNTVELIKQIANAELEGDVSQTYEKQINDMVEKICEPFDVLSEKFADDEEMLDILGAIFMLKLNDLDNRILQEIEKQKFDK